METKEQNQINVLTKAVMDLSGQIKTLTASQGRLQRTINQMSQRAQGYQQLSIMDTAGIDLDIGPSRAEELPGQLKLATDYRTVRKYQIKPAMIPQILQSVATAFDNEPRLADRGSTYKLYVCGKTRTGHKINEQYFRNFTSAKDALCWAVLLGRKSKIEFGQNNPKEIIRDRKFSIGIVSPATVKPGYPQGKIMRGRRYEFDPGTFGDDESIVFIRSKDHQRMIGARITEQRIEKYYDRQTIN